MQKTYSIVSVAKEIHEELGTPDTPTENFILNWISCNAGRLNNKISTYFELKGQDYSPQLFTDEKDILKALYYVYYYSDLSRKALLGASGENRIVTLKDDLSSVSFVSSKDIARAYRDEANVWLEEANSLARLYKHNRTGPRDPHQKTPSNKYWE